MSDPKPSQALAKRWFQKAENDLLNVENNLKAETYPADTVCFHCQQAAEKYLKGFLAWQQMPFIKTHDLLALLQQVTQIAASAEKLSPDLHLLDQYSVEIRYPQEYGEMPDEEEVQAAVEATHTVRAWIRSTLKLEKTDA